VELPAKPKLPPDGSANAALDLHGELLPLASLRFFLAMWVLYFHQTYANGVLGYTDFIKIRLYENLVRTGYVAVTVFFVLSGFVLAYKYPLESRWTLSRFREYAVSRFSRIYPLYLVGLLLLIPFFAWQIHKGEMKLADQIFPFSLQVGSLQAWFPLEASTWNFPGWSISCETFFYLCFPFSGYLLWKLRSTRQALLALCLLWIAATAAPLYTVVTQVPGFGDTTAIHDPNDVLHAQIVKFNPALRLPEFLLGVLTARLYRLLEASQGALFGRGYLLSALASAAFVGMIVFADKIPYPLMHNGCFTPVFCTLILGLALGSRGIMHKLLSLRLLVVLGKASYALYILQYPLERILQAISFALYGEEIQNWTFLWTYLAVMVLASVAVFYWVEEPMRRWLRRFSRPKPKLAATASSAKN
jgi:peptidoglycan/LPS O-acetylase OafA/YrhL